MMLKDVHNSAFQIDGWIDADMLYLLVYVQFAWIIQRDIVGFGSWNAALINKDYSRFRQRFPGLV
jgi:hypothetical protein